MFFTFIGHMVLFTFSLCSSAAEPELHHWTCQWDSMKRNDLKIGVEFKCYSKYSYFLLLFMYCYCTILPALHTYQSSRHFKNSSHPLTTFCKIIFFSEEQHSRLVNLSMQASAVQWWHQKWQQGVWKKVVPHFCNSSWYHWILAACSLPKILTQQYTVEKGEMCHGAGMGLVTTLHSACL